MPKVKRKESATVAVVPRARQPKWTIPQALKSALTAHARWPNLRVPDWQELARQVLGIDHAIKSTDRRYGLIHQYCKNARKRLTVRETALPS